MEQYLFQNSKVYKSQNWFKLLSAHATACEDQKSSRVTEISIEKHLSEQRLPQYEASKYLFVLAVMLRSSNFQGASTFVGATWLRIYRATGERVRAMYVSAAYRLPNGSLVDRINRQARTGTTRLSILLPLLQSIFNWQKSIFYPSTPINFAANWCTRPCDTIVSAL